MALFDRETDPEKERNGVPLDFGDYRVTLRRQGGANERYEQELEKETKPFRAALRAGCLAKSKEEELVFRAFARTCVARWETLVNGAFVDGIDMRGKLVPCNEDSLVAVFKALPGVFLDLREAARGEQLFRKEQQEDDAGNS